MRLSDYQPGVRVMPIETEFGGQQTRARRNKGGVTIGQPSKLPGKNSKVYKCLVLWDGWDQPVETNLNVIRIASS
jgi:hypothetical protein